MKLVLVGNRFILRYSLMASSPQILMMIQDNPPLFLLVCDNGYMLLHMFKFLPWIRVLRSCNHLTLLASLSRQAW